MKRRFRILWRGAHVLNVLAFLAFFAFVVASNDFDWDHFLTGAEVDRRAWVIDHEPPVWSYQLCGGVTRAGDPQAFGLSPLFLWVVPQGSFWGLKTAWLALAVLGFVSLRRILSIFLLGGVARELRKSERLALDWVSLAFVLGNYFLWHAHEGHLTIALGFLGLAIIEKLFSAFAHGFRWRSAVAATLMTWAYVSGGFYHSLVFFIAPLSLALILGVGWSLVAQRARRLPPVGNWSALAKLATACVLGIGIGFYKVYAVASYQALLPRTTTHAVNGVDGAGPLQTLVYQLVPSLDGAFLGGFRGWPPWGIWETSAFNLNAWGLLIAAGLTLIWRARGQSLAAERRSSNGGPLRHSLVVVTAIVGAVGLWFSLGELAPISGFEVLNRLTHNSVRVAGRFQILFGLAAAMGLALLLGRSRRLAHQFAKYGAWTAPVLLVLNLTSFLSTLRPESARSILSAPKDPIAHMNTLRVGRERSEDHSYMYRSILRGIAMLNCYDPIARETRLVREFVGRPEFMNGSGHLQDGTVLPLIDPQVGSPPESCRAGSYFTQNRIVMDASCPVGTCVNANGLNLWGDSRLVLNTELNKYCLGSSSR
ncbi:MAG: hypothetical protein JST54_15855 [Deltaproteobacteria bacterium]|nr:hypothetical protein [Deltaproteobacteria bacterium]